MSERREALLNPSYEEVVVQFTGRPPRRESGFDSRFWWVGSESQVLEGDGYVCPLLLLVQWEMSSK